MWGRPTSTWNRKEGRRGCYVFGARIGATGVCQLCMLYLLWVGDSWVWSDPVTALPVCPV